MDRDAREEGMSLARLSRVLGEKSGRAVSLVLNSNRHTLISFKRPRKGTAVAPGAPMRVSLHHSFLRAPEEVLDAVASFLRGEETPRTRATLGQFMDAPPPAAPGNGSVEATRGALPLSRRGGPGDLGEPESSLDAIPDGTQLELFDAGLQRRAEPRAEPRGVLPAAPPGLVLAGQHHDLRRIADVLNYLYFGGHCPVHITWGRTAPGDGDGSARHARRSILFGTYSAREHLVRVHPRLDAPDVPDFYVEFIVYHEMLHKAQPPVYLPSGRRQVHTPAFRAAERRFLRYRDAILFERAHLKRLLRTAAPAG